ncbi:MAG: dinitrogenase iron-molybdenum cofactor biosynthesis protein [Calditrichaeota bacterium]|nr:dinitrogenase iron-molybdenum cofactor biosynthesis protein [Calditrichota bacterium]
MIIAVPAVAPDIDAEMDRRLGRCAYFVFVDSETGEWKAERNPGADAASGAGVLAVQTIVNGGAEALAAPDYGPNAYEALAAAGVKMYLAKSGTVREIVEKVKKGELEPVSGATSAGMHGPGHGGGRMRRW